MGETNWLESRQSGCESASRRLMLLPLVLLLLASFASAIPSNFEFVSPTSTGNLPQDWFYVNVTFDEALPDTCLLEVNSTNNFTMTRVETNCYFNMTEMGIGNHSFKVFANDTSNNFGVSDVQYAALSTCGTLQETSFTLNGTINDSTGGTCISIANADTTLDCNYSVLTGSGGKLIYSIETGITLNNCVIRDGGVDLAPQTSDGVFLVRNASFTNGTLNFTFANSISFSQINVTNSTFNLTYIRVDAPDVAGYFLLANSTFYGNSTPPDTGSEEQRIPSIFFNATQLIEVAGTVEIVNNSFFEVGHGLWILSAEDVGTGVNLTKFYLNNFSNTNYPWGFALAFEGRVYYGELFENDFNYPGNPDQSGPYFGFGASCSTGDYVLSAATCIGSSVTSTSWKIWNNYINASLAGNAYDSWVNLLVNNDTVLSGSQTNFLQSFGGANINVTNTTGIVAEQVCPNGGEINRFWYVTVNVTNASFEPISGASLSYVDYQGGSAGSNSTQADGTAFEVFREDMKSGGGCGTITRYAPYNITASKTGFDSNTTTFNFTGSSSVLIVLSATAAPPQNGGGGSGEPTIPPATPTAPVPSLPPAEGEQITDNPLQLGLSEFFSQFDDWLLGYLFKPCETVRNNVCLDSASLPIPNWFIFVVLLFAFGFYRMLNRHYFSGGVAILFGLLMALNYAPSAIGLLDSAFQVIVVLIAGAALFFMLSKTKRWKWWYRWGK